MTDEETNDAVAKKMGWEKVVGPAPMHHVVWIRKGNFGNGTELPPAYAFDIKAAWEIVERFKPTNAIVLNQHIQSEQWSCQMWTAMTEEPDFTVTADTAPMAICRAFLKLTEPKEPK